MSLDLQPGSIVDGRYEVIDNLGRGGYATVLRARQVSTGQVVALKLLMADELYAAQLAIQRARFEREMELIGRLQHPNIVRLIDSGTLSSGDHYSVLEYVQGMDLARWLGRKGPMGVAEAAHVMMQVLDALSCAHALGIVHRDLKPGNIMVTTSSARRNAMVLDFGIAGIVETSRDAQYQALTMAGTIVGSPSYMSPEQVRGEPLTVQSDLYSWGLVFIECLTGRKAVDGSAAHDCMAAHLMPDPIDIPASIVGFRLRSLLQRCVAKTLEQRFKSAQAVMAALSAWTPLESDVDLGRVGFGSESTVPVSTADPRMAALIDDFKRTRDARADDTDEPATQALEVGHLEEPPTQALELGHLLDGPPQSLSPLATLDEALDTLDGLDDEDSDLLGDDGPTTVAMAPVDALHRMMHGGAPPHARSVDDTDEANIPPTRQMSLSEVAAATSEARSEAALAAAPQPAASGGARGLVWVAVGLGAAALFAVVWLLL